MKTHYRSIFLSDIHLGTRDCDVDALLSFLKVHTCDKLYLVGDIIDGWRLKNGLYWPQKHSDVIRRFLTLSKRGTEIYFIIGNHDEFLRQYNDVSMGNIHLLDNVVHTTSNGKRYLVIHGDQYDLVTKYYKLVAVLGDVAYMFLLLVNRLLRKVREKFSLGRWSFSAWAKRRVKQAVNFVSDFENYIAKDCHDMGYDGVICGHIHHAEIRDLNGIKYVNCGDWVESCTAIVEDVSGELSIVRWEHKKETGYSN